MGEPSRSSRIGALVAVLLFATAPIFVDNYYDYVLQRLLLLAVLALGLNLFQGYCGQVNFGVSGFVAFGAYGSGLIEVKLHVHPLLTIVPAVAIGVVVAYLLSFVVLRLRAMSQALVTIAFAITVYSLLNTAVPGSWGGGDSGFSLPAIKVAGHRFNYTATYYVLVALLGITFLFCVLVVRSPIGRAWTAIRDDETAAAASGVNVTKYMRQAFVLNGAIAALGGVMMAMQSRYIAPDNVNLFSNILVLLAVVIGGQGSNIGVLLGSVALIVIGEVISGLQDFPTLIYGLILFVVMRFLPRGLWPHLRSGVTRVVDRIRRPGVPAADAAAAPADEPTLVGVEQ